MKIFVRLLAAIYFVLPGCGGAEDDTAGASNAIYTLEQPKKLVISPQTGNPSFPAAVADYGVGMVSFLQSIATGSYGAVATYFAHTSSAYQIFPTTHLTPEVINAWASGWTGKGVSISVIDDYTSSPINIAYSTPHLIRTVDIENGNANGKVKGTHDIVYKFTLPQTRGNLASNIAGGDFDGVSTSIAVAATVSSDVKTGCSVLRPGAYGAAYTSDCDTNYYIQTYPATSPTIHLDYKLVAGVAKEANIINNNVILSSAKNPIQTIADLQGHLQNSANLGVINLNLGSDIPTSGLTFDEVMWQAFKFPIANMNSVIAVAAGNGGAPCAAQDLNGCNSMAVALAFQGSTKASTLVVGALSGSGTQENIAIYSTRAGILADRFILASGETGIPNVIGTSYAAPRVAGIAAILKQKYPGLTPAQIANIILLSASKDINNTGVDTFTGVSLIYGHGKASLTRALALAASL